MVEVIRNGQCDIIGAARPSIADPFLPRKIEEGRFDDIRECIGCNACISRWEIGGPPLVCTQNATSGEEFRRGWHPEKFTQASNSDNDVLVVGAGPAGMECAMVLGKRGMRRVHLVDAGPDIGGHMRWVPQLPGLGEWGRVVNYRRIQLDKLKNVEVITGTELAAKDVLEYGAEIVVAATGSSWATDGMSGITNEPIPGADASLPHVATPEQVMLGDKEIGQRVLVYDCEMYYTGIGMAEKLVREGKDVTYVTPFEAMAPYTVYTLEFPRLNRHLRQLGIDVVVEHVVTAIEPGKAELAEVWTEEEHAVEVDTVVLVTQRVSDDALYRELSGDPDALAAAGIDGLYQIGDCVLPSLIAEAVFSGHRLAREIDSPNPGCRCPTSGSGGFWARQRRTTSCEARRSPPWLADSCRAGQGPPLHDFEVVPVRKRRERRGRQRLVPVRDGGDVVLEGQIAQVGATGRRSGSPRQPSAWIVTRRSSWKRIGSAMCQRYMPNRCCDGRARPAGSPGGAPRTAS